jgi:hypothetical protein
MGLAADKYTRREADPLAREFFQKYEAHIKSPTPGFKYEQVYDLNTKAVVNEEYLKIQDEVRAEFKEMGLEVLPS